MSEQECEGKAGASGHESVLLYAGIRRIIVAGNGGRVKGGLAQCSCLSSSPRVQLGTGRRGVAQPAQGGTRRTGPALSPARLAAGGGRVRGGAGGRRGG